MDFRSTFHAVLVGFRSKGLWTIASLMFVGKMLWFFYWGTLLEVDSVGYLEFQTALYHPPSYVVFCGLIVRIFGSVEAIVIAQSAILSISVGLLLSQYIKKAGWIWVAGLVLALDPCTGLLCADVMAETLFLSFLILGFCLLRPIFANKNVAWNAILLGVFMALAYLTRYAAPIYMLALVILFLASKLSWRSILKASFWMIFAFQIMLLPMRLYYWTQFETPRFNVFTELSIFNSSAYLFPESRLKNSPETDFEQVLQAAPDSIFEMQHTWYTNHAFNGQWPYQLYTSNRPTSETLQIAQSVGKTGQKLILEAPVRHLKAFVLPNMARPFWHNHRIYADRLPALIHYPVAFQKTLSFNYETWTSFLLFPLLIFATAFQVRFRKRMPWLAAFLVMSTWLYLGVVSFLAVFFLRFIYMLLPLILMAIVLQWNAYFEENQSLT